MFPKVQGPISYIMNTIACHLQILCLELLFGLKISLLRQLLQIGFFAGSSNPSSKLSYIIKSNSKEIY